MTVNRSIFIFIKRQQILFAGGLMTGLALTIGYTIATSPLRQTCFAPASFYTIKDENNVTLARGIYRSYRDGLHEGHTTYIGNIRHFQDGKRVGQASPVQRSVNYTMSFSGNLLHLTMLSHARRLGDQSNEKEVTDYIFPQLKSGETSTSSLYLLENSILASGTETVVRIACTN